MAGKVTKTLMERFEAKYIPEPMSGCWLWEAVVNNSGYGFIHKTGNPVKAGAHRVSWELHRGPIPDGWDVDHTCRNRFCVNPDHLEPKTRLDNLACGQTLVAIQVSRAHCQAGHPYDDNTSVYRGKRRCRDCARQWSMKSYYRRKAA